MPAQAALPGGARQGPGSLGWGGLNRGPAQTTRVTVTTTVDTTGGKHAVTGENLTPAGTQCVQATVDKADFIHEVGASPTVTFGINEGSGFSGAVRLGQTSWCDCYAQFANQPPPLLTARIKLVKNQPTPAEITFEPSGSTEGDALAACLKGKIATVPAKLTTLFEQPLKARRREPRLLGTAPSAFPHRQ